MYAPFTKGINRACFRSVPSILTYVRIKRSFKHDQQTTGLTNNSQIPLSTTNRNKLLQLDRQSKIQQKTACFVVQQKTHNRLLIITRNDDTILFYRMFNPIQSRLIFRRMQNIVCDNLRASCSSSAVQKRTDLSLI